MSDSAFERIHQIVQLIPYGRVATYGQIARLLGMTRGARTVGWALRSVPEGLDVPWQRVINARGTISFRPDSPGAVIQRALLEEEGVIFDEQGRVDLTVYGWAGPEPAELRHLLEPEA
jgi:methylated-DNA-protein-cysteine methyltransferase-like protein